MEKIRYIALTDIFHGFEVDDIQSMLRLLLYSNEIDIEGLIATTSCFVKNGAKAANAQIIHEIVDAYGAVRSNLVNHADGYPTAEYLHSVVCCGISEFGRRAGRGFAHDRYCEVDGVKRIIQAADKDDPRPLWIGLWGGANTLAQAVWQVQKTRSATEFDRFLSKLHIYGISDQDFGGKWLRDNFGDKLFYIVSPSNGSWFGNWTYYKATWPGISSDNFNHGSEDGVRKSKGFGGADFSAIDNDWITKNIMSKGAYGSLYPLPTFITEGDSPTYLGLIPNGLNVPERPDFGGWGGRYNLYKPDKKQFGTVEKYPIWTNVSDAVVGTDNQKHTSPQATIWRWRRAFQNDFAARMIWTTTSDRSLANHAPTVQADNNEFTVKGGDKVDLSVIVADPDGDSVNVKWYQYLEAGSLSEKIILQNGATQCEVSFIAPHTDGKYGSIHVIAEVTDNGKPSLTRYCRFVINVE